MKFLKWWIQQGLHRYEQSLFISIDIMAAPRDIRSEWDLIVLGTEQTR